MDDRIDDVCDPVDAMVFSGDALLDKENLEKFRMYLIRWGKECDNAEEAIKELEKDTS